MRAHKGSPGKIWGEGLPGGHGALPAQGGTSQPLPSERPWPGLVLKSPSLNMRQPLTLLITGLAAGTAGLVVVLPGQEGALGAREAGGSATRLCAGRLQVVTGWTAPATDQTVPLLVGDTVTVGAGSAALAPGTGQQEEEGLGDRVRWFPAALPGWEPLSTQSPPTQRPQLLPSGQPTCRVLGGGGD